MPQEPSIDNPPSLDELCDAAVKLQIAGKLALAEPLYRSILERLPTHGAANYCLGMLLVQLQRPADGLAHLLAALNATPDNADYWLGYLEALLLLGDVAQATQTLALARQHGLAGRAADEFAMRLAAVRPPARGARRREALAIGRQEAAVLALVSDKRFADALPVARGMTERFPRHGPGWKLYGAMLWAAGSLEDALTAMQTSARLLPDDAEVFSNFGSALNKVQRLDEGESYLQRALAIDPSFSAAHANLGVNYQMQGRYAEAEAHFRRSIALSAGNLSGTDFTASNLLFMLNHNPSVDAAALFEEHRRLGAQWEQGLNASNARHPNDPDPQRRLEVGLVSADLRSHAVANFLEPVLQQWARNGTLRVTAYYNHPSEDDVSQRLRGHVSRWIPVTSLSDAQLAQKIADDGIDILIDLAGHTGMHRLRAFAHRPAPVQASWLGYPATTGLQSMDYYLADRHFLPPGQFDPYYTEKLAYLPVVWPFQPAVTAPAVNRLPALDSGTLSFGSFNRIAKINEPTVQLWSQLLRALPQATLMIAGVPLERQHHRLIAWFAAAGVGPERLSFHPWTHLEALLALHHRVDIALEPMPYTGCTTSNQALWMGLPTLTLAGNTPASRLCAANLGHLGLEEFIASSPADFLAKGLHWAEKLSALAELRAGLRTRWQASPARDPAFVAAGIERGLRHMWQRWCAGLPPQTFEITAAELE
jgi:predicted O-linked N-acetylglucosamine transferase (SPINDLY family)